MIDFIWHLLICIPSPHKQNVYLAYTLVFVLFYRIKVQILGSIEVKAPPPYA